MERVSAGRRREKGKRLTSSKKLLNRRSGEEHGEGEENTSDGSDGDADDHRARDLNLRVFDLPAERKRQNRSVRSGREGWKRTYSAIELTIPTPHMTKQPGKRPMKKVQPSPHLRRSAESAQCKNEKRKKTTHPEYW
jgi:hypothetical protein